MNENIKCRNCGFGNSSDIKFCGNCGEKLIIDLENKEERFIEEQDVKLTKTKKNNLPVIIGVAGLIIVSILLFLNFNSNVKKFKNSYVEDNKELANEIYDDLSKKDIDELEAFFKSEIVRIEEDFNKENITYGEVEKQLSKIMRFSKLNSEINTANKTIKELNDSRKSYIAAGEDLDKKEYFAAYKNYNKVIKEDDNYNSAQDKITEIKERVKLELLNEAENYNKEGNFKKAIKTIDEALKLDTNDSKLKDAKENYELTQAKAEEKAAKEKEEKRLAELEAKKLTVGKMISNSKMEIEYLETKFTTKILPANTSGFYTYYAAEDDSIYFDIIFRVKNIDKYEFSLDGIFTDVKMNYNNGYTYNGGYFYYENRGDIDSVYRWDRLEPLKEVKYHVVINVPRNIADDNKPVQVTLKVGGKEQILNYR